ncbi:MAG: sigma-54-dependent transcriptional regulator [Thermodesulfobacteriota bacterium]
MNRDHLVVIDDDKSFRTYLTTLLESIGHRVTCFASGEEAVEALEKGLAPSMIILDIIMEGLSGIEVLKKVRQIREGLPIIMLTGVDQTQTIVEAMRFGASDYLVKPFEAEELEIAIRNVFEKADLVDEIKRLRTLLHREDQETAVFHSPKMLEIFEIVRQVAETDVTVLVHGESGVGKEVVAKRVHQLSPRAEAPFVKVNCAALPNDLLESELFGYEKGAFTGATRSKPGKFELAQRGTIFLDEIGEMSLPTQAKLLQVLQDGEFARLGGQRNIRVDVRVLVATNKDLETMVGEQQFREDLYYRLNVISLHVPPLRERKEEIPVLTDLFTKKFSRQFNKKVSRLPEVLVDAFLRHDWPGNVRELENMIKRYVVLRDEKIIQKELADGSSLPMEQEFDMDLAGLVEEGKSVSLKAIDKKVARLAEGVLISRVLQHTKGNKRKAAEILQISYKALLYKIKECQL